MGGPNGKSGEETQNFLPSFPSAKTVSQRTNERTNPPPLPLAVPLLPRQPQNYTLFLLSCLKSLGVKIYSFHREDVLCTGPACSASQHCAALSNG